MDAPHDLLGLTPKDMSLFGGGILMVLAVLILGWYGGNSRRDSAGGCGWFLLILAVAAIAWGMYHRTTQG